MCFTDCCVHTNVLNVYVQVLRKLTSVVVFAEKPDDSEESYTN